jgi:hypothetical protein
VSEQRVGPVNNDTAHLELRKLQLEVAEAEFRFNALQKKDILERDKLDQEIIEKKLQNETTKRMARIGRRKALLEIKEKQIAISGAWPAATWEILKYAAAVVPIGFTAWGLYWTYHKDTETYRHQLELEQKFKVDEKAISLLNSLAEKNNPAAMAHAAWALESYGRPSIRLFVTHLKMDHISWSYPVLVESLVNVILGESSKSTGTHTDQELAANEAVDRIVAQADTVVTEFLSLPTDSPRKIYVKAHLLALKQLQDRCAAVCGPIHAALRNRLPRIQKLIDRLEPNISDLGQEGSNALREVKEVVRSYSSPGVGASR